MKKFELRHRNNGTWYLHIEDFNLYTNGFGNSSSFGVISYMNELSFFLDDTVFKSDMICYKLDNGFSYGEIVDVLNESSLEELTKQQLMTIYKDAQKWFEYNYNTGSELSYKDYSNLRTLVYNAHETEDENKRFSYFKILKIIDAMKDFKDL